MKAFHYSLQRLLDTKEALEKGSQRRVAQAIRDVEREQAALEQVRLEIGRAAEWRVPRDQTLDVRHLTLRSQYLGLLRARAERIARRIEECRRVLALRQEELRQVARERGSLERLREREYRAWLLDFRRMEQRDMDETASHQDLHERRTTARDRERAA